MALADAEGNGIPDAVDTVARTYDAVAAFYAGLGYRSPPEDSGGAGEAGGDGRFDVYRWTSPDGRMGPSGGRIVSRWTWAAVGTCSRRTTSLATATPPTRGP
ncbi:hypothetical protein ACN28S_26015 [Cystobacter fuscus]